EFLCHRLCPRDSADIGAKNNFHSGLHRLLKGLDMYNGPLAIALSRRCIGWPPIGVIDGKCGTVPGALLYHLGDLRVGNFEAMLNRIAATIQRALQSNSVVCMTCHFLGPSVSFVHDCLQLLDGESWLRH